MKDFKLQNKQYNQILQSSNCTAILFLNALLRSGSTALPIFLASNSSSTNFLLSMASDLQTKLLRYTSATPIPIPIPIQRHTCLHQLYDNCRQLCTSIKTQRSAYILQRVSAYFNFNFYIFSILLTMWGSNAWQYHTSYTAVCIPHTVPRTCYVRSCLTVVP